MSRRRRTREEYGYQNSRNHTNDLGHRARQMQKLLMNLFNVQVCQRIKF